ncbi:MAG TPA: GNAT family N-acetyltransferase [Thermoanaerobaculia bacterium]|nr:GNAT family N-acetyltransferase [Thermoanaerobaculia bacterium]
MATGPDALCLSVLATQVFLDTYATQGVRPAVAREVRRYLSEEAFAAFLSAPGRGILIAGIADHLAGFAQLAHGQTHGLLPPDARATELTRLYVQRPFLGKGIGKELLARAETLAAEEGAEILWLTAWTGNTHALRFYEARGYQDVGGSTYTFEEDTYETRVFLKRLAR